MACTRHKQVWVKVNLKAAVALHFAHYNFCRIHKTLRMTPAMAAGIADHIWDIKSLLST